MEETLVIGLGSGRSGTASQAGLLGAQPNATVTHERFGHHVPWAKREYWSSQLLRACRTELADGATIAGDVASYWLNDIDWIARNWPGRWRAVCMKRDKHETVESFLRKTRNKANHWAPSRPLARHKRWNRCFPTYPAHLSKPVAIARYWDEYYSTAQQLERKYPDNLRVFPVKALNDIAGQQAILDFVGVPREQQVVSDSGIQLNHEPAQRTRSLDRILSLLRS